MLRVLKTSVTKTFYNGARFLGSTGSFFFVFNCEVRDLFLFQNSRSIASVTFNSTEFKQNQFSVVSRKINTLPRTMTIALPQCTNTTKYPTQQMYIANLKVQGENQFVRKLATGAVVKKKRKSFKQKMVDEMKHYANGFKLFWMDLKIALKLTLKKIEGDSLTRREHKLLVRTLRDIFRLVPFSVFIIVPFMELTLPIFIKLFPGMLPSAFEAKSKKEAKLRKKFKMNVEMTQFLQETLRTLPPIVSNERVSNSAKEFAEFFRKLSIK